MISTAEAVFLAQAFVETIRPIVIKYQTQILAENQWKVRPEYQDGTEEEVITDPSLSYLMSESDFQSYHAKCNEARRTANLKVENDDQCPLLVAENLLRKAKIALCNAMEPVTNITYDKVSSTMDSYNRYFELVLRLLGPYVSEPSDLIKSAAAS